MLPETIKEIQLLHLEKGKKKAGFQPKIISDLNVSKETHGIGWAGWAPNFIGKCNFLMAFPYCAAQRNIRLIKILMSHFQKWTLAFTADNGAIGVLLPQDPKIAICLNVIRRQRGLSEFVDLGCSVLLVEI